MEEINVTQAARNFSELLTRISHQDDAPSLDL